MGKLPIEVAGDRTAPAYLVAALRRIDPTLDLIYGGDGRWMVLTYRPRVHRIRTGHGLLRTTMRSDHPDPGVARQGFAMIAGYALVGSFVIEGEPDWRIVEEIRAADWLYRHQPEVCERMMRPPSDSDVTDAFRKRMASVDVREVYRRHVRRQQTVYSYSGQRRH